MHRGADLTRLLDVAEESDDVFVGSQPSDTTLDKVYGGQLFAQSLAAAQRTVDDDRPAHSVQAFCLEAGEHHTPIRYRVERVRDGRSFSARAVVATQGEGADERQVMRLTASFHRPEPGLEHSTAAPAVPGPEELPSLQDVIRDHSTLDDEPWRRLWEGLDIRYVATDATGRRTSGPGVQQLWMRVRDPLPDSPTLHRQALVYLSDIGLLNASLIPHAMVMGDPELPRATLNHAVWLHDDVRIDEWFLVDGSSPRAAGALGLSRAEVFTSDGRHVASYAQEGLVRPRGDLRRRLGVEPA